MNLIHLPISRLSAVAIAGGLLLAQTVWAGESVETLANFTGIKEPCPGSNPGSLLQDKHGNFYGTTRNGGKNNLGTIFELPLNQPLITLHDFNGSDGSHPVSGLAEGPDGSLYGTTLDGGPGGKGTIFQLLPPTEKATIFKMNPPRNLKTLVALDGSNGASPKSGLLLGRDGNLYGTTFSGGAANKGVLFSVVPGSGKYTPLVTFNGTNGVNPGALSRSSTGVFYGTTYSGGVNDLGTVFKYDPDPQFLTLVSFSGPNGSHPQAELTELSDGNFYGTTYDGGKNNLGTVFSMTPDGVITTIVSFDGGNGAHPNSGLTQWSDGYFYMERIWDNESIKASAVQWSGVNFCGTTSDGGEHGFGTVFRVTNEGALTTLVSFSGTSGKQLGTVPNALTPGNDGNIYGTTYDGGSKNLGTVFRILLQIQPPASEGGNDGNSVSPPPGISP